MSKAEQILKLIKTTPSLTSADIAMIVGCHPSYARTARHRQGIFKAKHNPNISYKDKRRKTVTLKVEDYRKLCEKAGIKSEY